MYVFTQYLSARLAVSGKSDVFQICFMYTVYHIQSYQWFQGWIIMDIALKVLI